MTQIIAQILSADAQTKHSASIYISAHRGQSFLPTYCSQHAQHKMRVGGLLSFEDINFQDVCICPSSLNTAPTNPGQLSIAQ